MFKKYWMKLTTIPLVNRLNNFDCSFQRIDNILIECKYDKINLYI